MPPKRQRARNAPNLQPAPNPPPLPPPPPQLPQQIPHDYSSKEYRKLQKQITREELQDLNQKSPHLETISLECIPSPHFCWTLGQMNWLSLKQLFLREDGLSGYSCKLLSRSRMPMLIRLWLYHNEVGNSGTLHLTKAQWPLLKTISVNRNRINDDGVASLGKVVSNNVDFIYLWGNKLTVNGVKRLIIAEWPMKRSSKPKLLRAETFQQELSTLV